MSLHRRRIGAVSGLESALGLKLEKAAIKATLSDVLDANNATTVVATAAFKTFSDDITSRLDAVEQTTDGMIDDTATDGSDTTWSVDKIKSYVASVDDSIMVDTIDARNEISDPFETMIAYVLDTTGDTDLGDFEGQSAAYMYKEGDGWKLLQILGQDIDTDTLVLKSSIVDDLTTGGTEAPLSAEQGKTLKSLIDNKGSVTVMEVETGLAITGDDFTVAHDVLGSIVGLTAEVEVDDGTFDVVDVTAGDSATEWKLVPATSGDYDGKTCRVSYLREA